MTSNSLCQYLKDKEISKDYEELAVSSFEVSEFYSLNKTYILKLSFNN